ncbi:FAD-dependent thymidylate synthase [Sphingobium sp. CFD-1]|uniref:FAD-dependent thymidylate synthase n=1 Tax=Sphingobium sp. CFD-1 TaxID=2878545 RepID=UPI00214CCD2F|nr:FAD-dependent thymidylate synthase [Sphingobium sp. CFD-1]
MSLPIADVSVEYVSHMGDDTNVVNAARVSFAKGVQEFTEKDQGLLNYLAKHNHWSPFAHTCISVRCKVPIFLARQLVKHQVGGNWNEESRRYIDGPVEFYLPKELHSKPDNAKQGSGGVHDKSARILRYMISMTQDSYSAYNYLLTQGVAPEEARMILPLNSMTNFIWTGSLLFMDRVITQRIDGHAQLIAQDFAKKLRDVVQPLYPNSFKALEAARA